MMLTDTNSARGPLTGPSEVGRPPSPGRAVGSRRAYKEHNEYYKHPAIESIGKKGWGNTHREYAMTRVQWFEVHSGESLGLGEW